MQDFDLYLASASPRRKALLEQLGLTLQIVPADIDESRMLQEPAKDYVLCLAQSKAKAVFERLQNKNDITEHNLQPVLAADTVVVLGEQVFGKPVDEDDAMRIWRQLSANTHSVMTAIALIGQGAVYTAISVSEVRFVELDDRTMQQYWRSGEPVDKAGGYAIQGAASAWVESISGSYSGVVGLPLFELNQLLKQVDLNWL